MNGTLDNRVLGRVLAVEELNDVSGGWTSAADHDTTKTKDTGAHQVDVTTITSEIGGLKP
ncbi:MAG: hypothetical protein E6Q50_16650 [Lysobacter sp.]|nr:MAG: hypothetical protein E6Q50_16650 [Lysobacter sp.]